MSTTSLFVDLLISGIQVAMWLCLLVGCIFGADPKLLSGVKDWSAVLAVLLLPIVYPVGIFIDNLADDLLRPIGRRIRKRFALDETPSVMKLLARTKDDFLPRYFDYVRTRIRISRSSALNFSLITLFGELFIWLRWRPTFGATQGVWMETVGLLGGALTVLAVFSWYRITMTFSKKLAYGFSLLGDEQRWPKEQVEEAVAEIVA
jgi:hypothetical protein